MFVRSCILLVVCFSVQRAVLAAVSFLSFCNVKFVPFCIGKGQGPDEKGKCQVKRRAAAPDMGFGGWNEPDLGLHSGAWPS